MSDQGMILFIKAVTPVHNGSGTGLGHVDRPIIRERKTEFPFIQAATIKGNFRHWCAANHGDAVARLLFGASTEDSDKSSGLLEFTDGYLLAFPVRSLNGLFAWTTSALPLYRLRRLWPGAVPADLADDGLMSDVGSANCRSSAGKGENETYTSPLYFGAVNDRRIFLEDMAFTDTATGDVTRKASAELAKRIFPNRDESWIKGEYEKKFVLLREDDFRRFVKRSTQIEANIRIGEYGVTATGSLRYSEFLPAETILFARVTPERNAASAQKKINEWWPSAPDHLKTREDLAGDAAPSALKLFKAVFAEDRLDQLGGDETKGKGLVSIAFHDPAVGGA